MICPGGSATPGSPRPYVCSINPDRTRQHIGVPFGPFLAIKRQPLELERELLKPFTDSASLLVDIEKNVLRFSGGRHK